MLDGPEKYNNIEVKYGELFTAATYHWPVALLLYYCDVHSINILKEKNPDSKIT
jgi:hypothetical protein